VVAISAGRSRCLALQADGTAVAWGDSKVVPASLSNLVSIAAGDYASLFLKADGTVAAVGTSAPAGLSNVVAIAAGGLHNLVLQADGTVVGWGDNSYGQNSIPAGLDQVVAIAAGDYHSSALRVDGTVVVWGKYYTGTSYIPATTPAGITNVVAIAAGSDHDLAFFGNGSPPPALRLVTTAWAGGLFSVSLPTQNGRVYRLEYKNSLTDPAWTPLPLRVGNGAQQVLSDTTPPGTQRFYRVSQW
jgi:alpha-tubulin suppressor-like RCC1 family protein